MRFFACGVDGTLKLIQRAEPPTTSNPPGGIPAGCTGLRWFTTAATDLAAVVSRCEAAGGSVVQPIEKAEPGSRFAILEDPEQNCWVEVTEHSG